jgi:hypothetical protein
VKIKFYQPVPRSFVKNASRRGTARHVPRAAEVCAARFSYSGNYTFENHND